MGIENIFYEKIEVSNREPLPFVPRYIGVLNVVQHEVSLHKHNANSISSNPRKGFPEVSIEQNWQILFNYNESASH